LLGVGPSIVSATIDGAPARLVVDDGWFALVARGHGRRSVVLKLVLPRGTEAGDSNIDLQVAPSPTNHLKLEIPRPAIAVAAALVPELQILGVEREWGHIGINATTNIEITATAKGLTPIDVKELPAEVWQVAQLPILLSYKYLSHPYELQLDVRRHEDVPVLA